MAARVGKIIKKNGKIVFKASVWEDDGLTY